MILVGGIAAMGYFTGATVFANSMQMVNNEGTSLDHIREYMKETGFDMAAFEDRYEIKRIEIPSSFEEHTIPADHILSGNEEDADTVIMVHGLGGNRLTVYPMAELFLSNGYNVIAYDQRSSGENKAPYTTYGYRESKDLIDYISCIDERIGKDKKIILWGTSFGGATGGGDLSKFYTAVARNQVIQARDRRNHNEGNSTQTLSRTNKAGQSANTD